MKTLSAILRLAAVGLGSLAVGALADTPPALANKVTPVTVATTSPLNLVLGLLFLLALVLVAAWLTRRFGRGQWQNSQSMKVLAALPVGGRERAVLIEVGGVQMLLGVAPGRVNLLHTFAEPVLKEGSGGEDFASKMRQLLQQGLNR